MPFYSKVKTTSSRKVAVFYVSDVADALYNILLTLLSQAKAPLYY